MAPRCRNTQQSVYVTDGASQSAGVGWHIASVSVFNLLTIQEFRAYRSGEAEDSVIPVYDAVSVGNRIPMFRGNVMTSFSNRGAGNEVHLIYRIE